MKYNYDIDANGNLVKSTEPTGKKETPTGTIVQFAGDRETMEMKNKTKTGKHKASEFTHTTYDPEKREVEVREYKPKSDDWRPGVTNYPVTYAGKENPALPKKSFSSDDVTVARLLKGKSPEEIEAVLKAVSSVYSAPGALSSKRSGGYEGVKLMGDIDKHKKKEPSELDPGYKPAVSGQPASLAPSNKELTGRKVNPKAVEALERMSRSTVKSILNACDDILDKAKFDKKLEKFDYKGGKETADHVKRLVRSDRKEKTGDDPLKVSVPHRYEKYQASKEVDLEKANTAPKEMMEKVPQTQYKYEQSEKRKAARGDVPKPKQKADIDKPRIPKHIAQGKDEFLKKLQSENASEPEEKSYSLDFNKSILERMGLEKGRKSAWESKGTKEDSDVRVAHSSDTSAGNLNPEVGERMQGIREAGDERSKKRMVTSTDPSDVAYAKKKGWIKD